MRGISQDGSAGDGEKEGESTVYMVPGSRGNIKLTTVEDKYMLGALLQMQKEAGR